MSSMILDVKNISVRYRTDAYRNMRPEKKLYYRLKGRELNGDFWALKDVSFQLYEGDVLGILGTNGSGKSTLLKTIAGTIGVQSGSIERKRKISALLELGTGFDPDLTVKENIYLRSALLGYSEEYVNQRYKEILDFADLKRFEQTAYRNLSSGMRSRMAFSIVSIMDPELLVLDEVFAVGDGAFREKSQNKMKELMQQGAGTILVSHSMGHVRSLCNRVLWLSHGRVVMDGPTEEVCREYSLFLKNEKQQKAAARKEKKPAGVKKPLGTVGLSVMAVGDICIGDKQLKGAYDAKAERYNFDKYFRNTKAHLTQADVAICNLEATFGKEEASDIPMPGAAKELASAMARAGFSVVATANDHIFSDGSEGVLRTQEILREQGLAVTGTRGDESDKPYAMVSAKKVKIAVLNYTCMAGKQSAHDDDVRQKEAQMVNVIRPENLETELDRIGADIAAARKDGAKITLVYFHWGSGYDHTSDTMQKYISFRTAQLGADAIFGSHAHVLQERRILKVVCDGKEKRVPVFYGLGNFVSAEKPGSGRENVRCGALAEVNIDYDLLKGAVTDVRCGWKPLYIAARGDADIDVLDLESTVPAMNYRLQSADCQRSAEQISKEIGQILNNDCQKHVVNRLTPGILTVPVGSVTKLVGAVLPEGQYERFTSDDTIIASVRQDGTVQGNCAGYAGIAATNDKGERLLLMVHVTESGEETLLPLVDIHNRVRAAYVPADLVAGKEYFLPAGVRLCRSTACAWRLMREYAATKGVYLKCGSGFRDWGVQQWRLNKYAEKYGADKAVKRYMPLGHSEHHLGTALDVYGAETEQGKTSTADAIKWVWENAHKFGFTARKSKVSIDKLAYAHIRYIGPENVDWETVFLKEDKPQETAE